MLGLTKRQREVLDFIKAYTADNDGIAPTYAEIGAAVGLKSKSSVHRNVHGLVERGAIAGVSAGHYVKKRSLSAAEPSQKMVDCVAVLVGMARFGIPVSDDMIRDTLRVA